MTLRKEGRPVGVGPSVIEPDTLAFYDTGCPEVRPDRCYAEPPTAHPLSISLQGDRTPQYIVLGWPDLRGSSRGIASRLVSRQLAFRLFPLHTLL